MGQSFSRPINGERIRFDIVAHCVDLLAADAIFRCDGGRRCACEIEAWKSASWQMEGTMALRHDVLTATSASRGAERNAVAIERAIAAAEKARGHE
jgi:hypothetical protein